MPATDTSFEVLLRSEQSDGEIAQVRVNRCRAAGRARRCTTTTSTRRSTSSRAS